MLFMVHKNFSKSVRVRYVLNGVPQEIDLACDEIPEGLHYEDSCNFLKENLWSTLMLNRNEDILSDIQIIGFNK